MVEVVNMQNCKPPWGQPGDVRIDRKTKWGNPFVMQSESERDRVCNMYEGRFLVMSLSKVLDIAEIADAKRLGCWCKPKRCHGDFLKRKIDAYNESKQKRLS
jgi:hypothetical protein